jgi:glycosyltransferase involved in cell wall biosynthesis
LLDLAGRRAAAALIVSHPHARIVTNGDNCLWPGINWVHYVHGGYRGADRGAPWWYRLKNRATWLYHRRREARLLRRSPLVITNSEMTRRDVIEGLGVDASRVHCVYLGVDPEQYAPRSEDEREEARAGLGVSGDVLLIVFVGALGYDRRKGFDTLLAALPQVRAALRRPVMVLAAGAGALGYWSKRVAALGLSDVVRLLGHVEAVPRLLAAADLFVSPVRYEPYGLNVHEAICRGVPAVVTRAAGVAERYPPELAGLLVDNPEDPAELASRLTAALQAVEAHAPHVRKLGAAWLCYTWESMAEAMVRLIEERAA